jgi:hypothetical protein
MKCEHCGNNFTTLSSLKTAQYCVSKRNTEPVRQFKCKNLLVKDGWTYTKINVVTM